VLPKNRLDPPVDLTDCVAALPAGVSGLSKGLLSRRIKIGKYLGIDLFVHWTFLLLAAYIFLSSLVDGLSVALFMIAQFLGVFFCVTLHEYGHAMAARLFGIGTADITLLPIGGVARLHQMPRIPWQEMIVAVAGPMVNVIIFFLLSLLFATQVSEEMLIGFRDLLAGPKEGIEISQDVATSIDTMFRFPSWLGYLFTMIVVNLILVLFNMIPAFPMDGGRVLRSFLAMFTGYTTATKVAFRVGVLCAGLMILFSVQSTSSSPIPIFIACFVAFAGYSEFKQVEMSEAVGGRKVSDAMIHQNLSVSEQLSLFELLVQWKNVESRVIPVVDDLSKPIGVLQINEVASYIAQNTSSRVTVGEMLVGRSASKTLRSSEPLGEALVGLDRRIRVYVVVNESDEIVGVLDLDSMVARLKISDHLKNEEDSRDPDFNQSI